MPEIYKVTVITTQGVNTFEVGGTIHVPNNEDGTFTDKHIATIKQVGLRITGDPYDHYCGFDNVGEMLFSINCLAPCEVLYS